MFPLNSNPINMTSVADEYTEQTNVRQPLTNGLINLTDFFGDIITAWSAPAIMLQFVINNALPCMF